MCPGQLLHSRFAALSTRLAALRSTLVERRVPLYCRERLAVESSLSNMLPDIDGESSGLSIHSVSSSSLCRARWPVVARKSRSEGGGGQQGA